MSSVLIVIHGAHSQPEYMAAQRETWLKDLDADYKYFLGEPVGSEGDVVYGGFPDGPIRDGNYGWHTRVLSDKTELLVRYALENGYDYAFKCDDDTYVRPDRLLSSSFEDHDYVGFTEVHSADGLGRYRWALGGSGYWLSRRAMGIIAANGLRCHRSEDYAVGQLLAWNGIQPYHDERYVAQIYHEGDDWITMHKVGPIAMRVMYDVDQDARRAEENPQNKFAALGDPTPVQTSVQ